MKRRVWILLAIWTGVSVIALVSTSQTLQAAPLSHGTTDDGPVPLPRDCPGVNPPDQPPPACCAYGYVYDDDGTPLNDVEVTFEGPGGVLTATTAPGIHSDAPYFAVSLSDAPLSASVGETITLSVEHAGRQRAVTYDVVEDGQQVDLVLPADLTAMPIVYVSGANDNHQLWRMNGDGTGRTYLRPGTDPDLCRATGRVLYTVGYDIYAMDLDGANVQQLTNGPGYYYNPDWSPDCSQIVYAWTDATWQYRLYTMDADGSDQRLLLTPQGTYDDWYPEWSPDGAWIAFTSTRGGHTNGAVYRIDADGTSLRYLASGWYPTWSPDSRRLAYVCFQGENVQDTCVMDADGGDQRRVANENQAWWPYWRSNDRLMYVAGGNIYGNHLDIFTIDADGTDKTNVTADGDSFYRSPTTGHPAHVPIATLHSLAPDPALQGRDSVTFRGSGQDPDAAGITAYRWRSHLDGELSAQAAFTLPASALSTGVHTITFQVQDSDGVWSPKVIRSLKVQAQPPDESWHFMLYLAGDNNLSNSLSAALDRLEAADFLLDTVTVTVQLDRQGGTGVYRYLVQPNVGYVDGINRWYLGELNSGDPGTLADYLQWAMGAYPADNVYLAIANHGRGIQGMGWDTESDDYLSLPEVRAALQMGTDNGAQKIDVLHLDACLMSMVEVLHEVQSHADYVVASENLGWSFFAYDQYVQALAPTTQTPRQVATRVAQIYASQDAATPYTIAALDTSRAYALTTAVDNLAGSLLATWPDESATVQSALEHVQRLDSEDYGRITAEDEFVDLRHLAYLLTTTSADAAVQQAAQEVWTAMAPPEAAEPTSPLVYESHQSGDIAGTWVDLDNTHGLGIYFPTSPASWDYAMYVDNPTLMFGQVTRWDELLRAYVGPPASVMERPSPPDPLTSYRLFLPLLSRGR